jgi:hypothetical protein
MVPRSSIRSGATISIVAILLMTSISLRLAKHDRQIKSAFVLRYSKNELVTLRAGSQSVCSPTQLVSRLGDALLEPNRVFAAISSFNHAREARTNRRSRTYIG